MVSTKGKMERYDDLLIEEFEDMTAQGIIVPDYLLLCSRRFHIPWKLLVLFLAVALS